MKAGLKKKILHIRQRITWIYKWLITDIKIFPKFSKNKVVLMEISFKKKVLPFIKFKYCLTLTVKSLRFACQFVLKSDGGCFTVACPLITTRQFYLIVWGFVQLYRRALKITIHKHFVLWLDSNPCTYRKQQ